MVARFKTIIVPTDFSDSSQMALHYGLDLVEPSGKVILCHVIDDIPLTYGYVGLTLPPADLRSKLAHDAMEELEAFVPVHDVDADVEPMVLHGSPYIEVVKLAKERMSDLVVMGTHGRTGLQHALLGSVAEKIVRKAPCPVMVVRSGGAGYSAS